MRSSNRPISVKQHRPSKVPVALAIGCLSCVTLASNSFAQEAAASLTQEKSDVSVLNETSNLMSDATERLANKQIGTETLRLQKQISKNLRSLLKSSESESTQQQGEESSTNSAKQRTAGSLDESPSQVASTGRRIDRKTLIDNAWGNLPPQMRDDLQSVANEEYLPEYRELIERYFLQISSWGKR